MSKGGTFLDFLFPPQCLGCNLWYAFDSDAVWCSECAKKYGSTHKSLIREIDSVFIYSAHIYESNTPIARVVHALKYERIAAAADICTEFLLPLLSRLIRGSDEKVFLVPVPLHERRLCERGFNQAEIVARGCVKHFDKKFDILIDTEMLERVRYTSSQALTETEDERHEHMENSFRSIKICDPKVVYILVDDVVTTGSTLVACITAMRRAGARRILAVTVASTNGASLSIEAEQHFDRMDL